MISNDYRDRLPWTLLVHREPRRVRPYLMYGSSEDELWRHYRDVRHVLQPIRSVRIVKRDPGSYHPSYQAAKT